MRLMLPLGIEDFAEMRRENYYYIDKTEFIRELLDRRFKVNLITRPRRFGKTLTMSMLQDFFDISRDSRKHFEGLVISKEVKLCDEWMNQWPVVAISLKDAEGLTFDDAFGMLRILISELCKQYAFLSDSDKVEVDDKKLFNDLKSQKADKENLKSSLILLCRMMQAHYGKQVILIIDEYDVPLAKASEHQYYSEMLDVIRSLLGRALKSNPYLKFAVVTGCLRISKESIFTGVNNFTTDAIIGDQFNEYVGFTSAEVKKLLIDAELIDHMEEVKEWYDGYRFGNIEVYCPWAVLNHVNALQSDPAAPPDLYWGNTSGNGIIYQYIDQNLADISSDIELLLDNGILVTQIEKNLTYDYIKSSAKNFWSLLYLTGYLTNANPADVREPIPLGYAALRIPNKEICEVFKNSILEWLNDFIVKIDRDEICNAIWEGNIATAQKLLSALLLESISYYDYQESYFHAFLAGLFAGRGCSVESNNEYGAGRPDIVVKDKHRFRALVIEEKYAKTESEIRAKLKEAQQQFIDQRYIEGIPDDYETVTGYCAVFCRKKCFLEKVPEERVG